MLINLSFWLDNKTLFLTKQELGTSGWWW